MEYSYSCALLPSRIGGKEKVSESLIKECNGERVRKQASGQERLWENTVYGHGTGISEKSAKLGESSLRGNRGEKDAKPGRESEGAS